MDLTCITPNITLDLKAEAVEYLIRETLKNHIPGYEVDKVIFSSSQERDMRGESCGTRFNGAKITFKKSSVVTSAWALDMPSTFHPQFIENQEK